MCIRDRLRRQSTLCTCDKLRKCFINRVDPKTSENVAYGRVKVEPSAPEDFETLSAGGDSLIELQPHPAYETINYSQLVD